MGNLSVIMKMAPVPAPAVHVTKITAFNQFILAREDSTKKIFIRE